MTGNAMLIKEHRATPNSSDNPQKNNFFKKLRKANPYIAKGWAIKLIASSLLLPLPNHMNINNRMFESLKPMVISAPNRVFAKHSPIVEYAQVTETKVYLGKHLTELHDSLVSKGTDSAYATKMLSDPRFELLPRVKKLQHSQPEVVKSKADYIAMFDVEGMAEKGKSFMTEYKHQLHLIEKRDSVPMELTTSVLGIESGFGRTAGKYCIVNSLATLFFEGRKNFAARELTSLFELCRLSNMDPFDVKGSFAGAIGFMQFIPSSLLPYIARGEITFKSALTMEGAIDLCADYLKKSGAQFGDTAANHKALLAYNNSENYAALIETVSGRISSEATVIREKIGSRPEIPAF